MDIQTIDTRLKVRLLNDFLRKTFLGGKIVMTASVAALDEVVRAEVLNRVKLFNDFTEDNNPHGENDMGFFEVRGGTYWFKIDYLDRAMEYGSPDPSNPQVTTRLMTIGEQSDY